MTRCRMQRERESNKNTTRKTTVLLQQYTGITFYTFYLSYGELSCSIYLLISTCRIDRLEISIIRLKKHTMRRTTTTTLIWALSHCTILHIIPVDHVPACRENYNQFEIIVILLLLSHVSWRRTHRIRKWEEDCLCCLIFYLILPRMYCNIILY